MNHSDFPVISFDECQHVGDLSENWAPQSARSPSLEAFCLSVSHHPDDWMDIAEISDERPVWTLSKAGAKFLDALALTEAHLSYVAQWGISQGYVVKRDLWRAWREDSETGEKYFMRFYDRESAEFEADVEEGETTNDDESGWIEKEPDAIVLTEHGMNALIRWREPRSGMDGLIILFTNEVLRPADATISGLWWDETYAPEELSCPRGGILPDALSEFTVRLSCDDEDEPVAALSI